MPVRIDCAGDYVSGPGASYHTPPPSQSYRSESLPRECAKDARESHRVTKGIAAQVVPSSSNDTIAPERNGRADRVPTVCASWAPTTLWGLILGNVPSLPNGLDEVPRGSTVRTPICERRMWTSTVLPTLLIRKVWQVSPDQRKRTRTSDRRSVATDLD